MKVAFTIWNNRIAPVFDTAGQIHIAETESGRVISLEQEFIPIDLTPAMKAARLKELGIEVLVCGAISRPLHETIIAHGIYVIPFVAGDLDEIIQAWLTKRSDWNVFAMPGCYGRRRYQFGQMYGTYNEIFPVKGRRPGRTGQGANRGQGRRGQGFGRVSVLEAADPSDYCVCPVCGRREPHRRGIPCFEQKCPNCGSAMTRQ
ncbi:MAG: hypothetical protein COT43_01310 [Candidatus Marinimicrobia bacterium CG08_land_8_20_14_0_20_45_22]|nr:MAG: hypothetical protein COT43_01310 [Candidatus Marinimicrobia bacterium CG08_land_8_20_14_0_20_45_22]